MFTLKIEPWYLCIAYYNVIVNEQSRCPYHTVKANTYWYWTRFQSASTIDPHEISREELVARWRTTSNAPMEVQSANDYEAKSESVLTN